MANRKSTKPNEPAQAMPLGEPWQLEDAVGSYYEAIVVREIMLTRLEPNRLGRQFAIACLQALAGAGNLNDLLSGHR